MEPKESTETLSIEVRVNCDGESEFVTFMVPLLSTIDKVKRTIFRKSSLLQGRAQEDFILGLLDGTLLNVEFFRLVVEIEQVEDNNNNAQAPATGRGVCLELNERNEYRKKSKRTENAARRRWTQAPEFFAEFQALSGARAAAEQSMTSSTDSSSPPFKSAFLEKELQGSLKRGKVEQIKNELEMIERNSLSITQQQALMKKFRRESHSLERRELELRLEEEETKLTYFSPRLLSESSAAQAYIDFISSSKRSARTPRTIYTTTTTPTPIDTPATTTTTTSPSEEQPSLTNRESEGEPVVSTPTTSQTPSAETAEDTSPTTPTTPSPTWPTPLMNGDAEHKEKKEEPPEPHTAPTMPLQVDDAAGARQEIIIATQESTNPPTEPPKQPDTSPLFIHPPATTPEQETPQPPQQIQPETPPHEQQPTPTAATNEVVAPVTPVEERKKKEKRKKGKKEKEKEREKEKEEVVREVEEVVVKRRETVGEDGDSLSSPSPQGKRRVKKKRRPKRSATLPVEKMKKKRVKKKAVKEVVKDIIESNSVSTDSETTEHNTTDSEASEAVAVVGGGGGVEEASEAHPDTTITTSTTPEVPVEHEEEEKVVPVSPKKEEGKEESPTREEEEKEKELAVVSTPQQEKKRVHNMYKQQFKAVSTTINIKPKSRAEKWTFIKGMLRLQAVVKAKKTRSEYKIKRGREYYRSNIVFEIFKTEEEYVGNLKVLVDVFLTPMSEQLRSNEYGLKTDQLKTLLPDIQVIRNYNTKFLMDLTPRLNSWSANQSVGDVFLQVIAFLKVYTQYISKYSQVLQELAELKRLAPKFTEFLESCSRQKAVGGQDISAYLIRPVQRIPRYVLLLKELVKHTDSEHRDYANLMKAWDQIRGVAAYVETKSLEAKNITKVLEIQSRLIGKFENLAQPTRKYVYEGELFIWSAEKQNKRKRVMFLFNDLLVETKPIKRSSAKSPSGHSTSFQYERCFHLYRLYPRSLPDTNREKHGIALVTDGDLTMVRLYASTALEKDQWIKHFNLVKLEIELKRKEHDELVMERVVQKANDYMKLLSGKYSKGDDSPEMGSLSRVNMRNPEKWEGRLRAHAEGLKKVLLETEMEQAQEAALAGLSPPPLRLALLGSVASAGADSPQTPSPTEPYSPSSSPPPSPYPMDDPVSCFSLKPPRYPEKEKEKETEKDKQNEKEKEKDNKEKDKDKENKAKEKEKEKEKHKEKERTHSLGAGMYKHQKEGEERPTSPVAKGRIFRLGSGSWRILTKKKSGRWEGHERFNSVGAMEEGTTGPKERAASPLMPNRAHSGSDPKQLQEVVQRALPEEQSTQPATREGETTSPTTDGEDDKQEKNRNKNDTSDLPATNLFRRSRTKSLSPRRALSASYDEDKEGRRLASARGMSSSSNLDKEV